MTFWKWENYGDSKNISLPQGQGEAIEKITKHKRFILTLNFPNDIHKAQWSLLAH